MGRPSGGPCGADRIGRQDPNDEDGVRDPREVFSGGTTREARHALAVGPALPPTGRPASCELSVDVDVGAATSQPPEDGAKLESLADEGADHTAARGCVERAGW